MTASYTAAALFTFVVATQTTQLRWNGASVSIADELAWTCGEYNTACSATPVDAGPDDLAETRIVALDGKRAVASAAGSGAQIVTMGKRITLNGGRLVLTTKGTKSPSLRLVGVAGGEVATFVPASGQGDDITGGVYDFMCNTNWATQGVDGFVVPDTAPCTTDDLSMARSGDRFTHDGVSTRVGSLYAATYPVNPLTLNDYGIPQTVLDGARPSITVASLTISADGTGTPLACTEGNHWYDKIADRVASGWGTQDVLDLGSCGEQGDVHFTKRAAAQPCPSTCPPVTTFTDAFGDVLRMSRFGRMKANRTGTSGGRHIRAAAQVLVPMFRIIEADGTVRPGMVKAEFFDVDGLPVDQFHWHVADTVAFELTDESGKVHKYRGDHKMEDGVKHVPDETDAAMSVGVVAGAAGGGLVVLILVAVAIIFVMKGRGDSKTVAASFSFDNPMYETTQGEQPTGDIATFDADFDDDGEGAQDDGLYSEPAWAGEGEDPNGGGEAEGGYMDVGASASDNETDGFGDDIARLKEKKPTADKQPEGEKAESWNAMNDGHFAEDDGENEAGYMDVGGDE